MSLNRIGMLAGLLGVATGLLTASTRAQSFNVSPVGLSAFLINGSQNPALTLTQGVAYVFVLTGTSIHPFWIKTNSTTGPFDAYNNGVVNNGSTSANVTFTVPNNAPSSLFYHCGNHVPMGGPISIVAAPASPTPPVVKIVFILMDTSSVTLKSTGATNWNVFPEFICDLTSTNWLPINNFTNTLANGTNTTSFNRSEVFCGANAFLRIRNQSN